jgi:glycine cleavage system aminomethyltransferase T
MQRVADDTVRVVTGAFDGPRDLAWIQKYMPKDGSVTVTDLSRDVATIGLWGPNAPALLATLTDADLSHEGSPYGGLTDVTLRCGDGDVAATLFRISYVGDSGWEIYVDWNEAPKVWDALMANGGEFRLRPTGMGVYAVSGRIEKGYRLQGAELESEYNPLEAGLARPKVKAADFIGKEAYMAAREAGEPEVQMCTLTVEDATDSQGRTRWMQGGNEPILTLDGDTINDSHGRVSRVTTAGYGPSVGKQILMAYLPRALAEPGTDLQVMYMNETFPVKVVRTDGPFDPHNTRLKN